MFHQEFYPTPTEVLEQMQIDCSQKVVLEPSAGKGNIVDFLIENEAKDILTSLNQFKTKYDGRIYDRLFQIFNIIELNGKSFRR